MNVKYRAKHPSRRFAALILAAAFVPLWASADDGGLTQQLRVQQHQSRFQLMLEQVQQQARRRALSHASTAAGAPASTPVDVGVATESMRLEPISVFGPPSLQIDQEITPQFRAGQAYERDQQRILEHRQQRRALIAPGTGSAIGGSGFAANRNELVRFKTQNRQQSLQRKLRN
jgi:hypothetical protein